jgi:hypothetical protein
MSRPEKSQGLGRNVSRPAILAFLSGVALAAAQPGSLAAGSAHEDWIAQYNGAYSYWDELHDLVLGQGCVYVTGFSYRDDVSTTFATVKYDDSGQQLWVRLYGLPGPNNSASASAIALDDAGNVFVTGRSADYSSAGFFVDAATLKYDPDGNLLWEQRYRLPGMNNQPQDIAIDRWGNAYVAGAAWVGSGFDVMLLKYSPDGTLLWHRTIGKSGDLWDAAFAVAIDANEDPVVAGYTEPFLFDPRSFGYLVKFSSDGSLLWEREHESYTNASTWWHVAINAEGRIYAFGEIAPPGDLFHVWTSQYDSSGNLIWDRHYNGTASGSNYSGGMSLTPTGGVVVNGTSDDFVGYGVTNIVTIRYEADGTIAWQRLERGGYDQAVGRDVAVDAAGNAYVTGYGFDQNENSDYVTLKYTPDGSLAWTQVFAGQAGFTDIPIRIAVDAAQKVFVAGDTHGGIENYFDYATIRYGQIQAPGSVRALPHR